MVKVNELKAAVLAGKAALNALLADEVKAKNALSVLLRAEKQDEAALTSARAAVEAITAKVSGAREALQMDEEAAHAEEQRLALEDAALAKKPSGRIVVADANFTKDPKKGFDSHKDFLSMVHKATRGVVSARADERLAYLAQQDNEDEQAAGETAYLLPVAFMPAPFRATVGSDEQGVYDDRYGGYAVRRTLLPGMLSLGMEADPTSGKTTAVPMATPMVEMLARTDKNHTSSVAGGLTVSRRSETSSISSSRMSMEKVTLKAASLFGLAYETEELISDSFISFAAMIAAGFKDQFAHNMLKEKLRGLGGNEYLGVLTALAASSLGPTISIAKETGQAAATIVAENVLKMSERSWKFDGSIWIANHNTKRQLFKLAVPVGTGGSLFFQPSQGVGFPDMLLGAPVYYSEYAATLGSQGDLILGCWSEYLEGLYQPLQSAESMHVRFLNHERAFKFWLRNAGAPWWKVALTPNQATDTLSPFVVLDAR